MMDSQTERQTDRRTDRHTDRYLVPLLIKKRYTNTEINRQMKQHSYKQKVRNNVILPNRQLNSQKENQLDILINI